MRIVEVREPAKVLDSLENMREGVEAVYSELIAGISAMTFTNVEWVKTELDEIIETQFVVRDV